MITRIRTAVVLLAIVAIPLYFQGAVLDGFVLLIGMYAAYELIKMYQTKKELSTVAQLLFFTSLAGQLGVIYNGATTNVATIFLIVSLGIAAVLNKDASKFGMSEVGFLFFSYVFISLTIYCIYYVLDISFMMFLYPILMAVVVDTGGYFGGYFFGKRKLIPEVSPKKTIEGAITSVLFASTLGTVYLCLVLDVSGTAIITAVVISVIISIVSQFGDLFASLLKREFGIKDFSNIFPGHGGVLDRIDGIIFNFLTIIIVFEVFANTSIGF